MLSSVEGMSPSRMSGVQMEVVHLYRKVLRAARAKGNGMRNGTVEFAKKEFREQAYSVSRTDFQTIEHMLRYGYKKVKLLNMPGVQAAQGFSVKR
ncbi:unnamed protein product [Choristocarpus tenellus]